MNKKLKLSLAFSVLMLLISSVMVTASDEEEPTMYEKGSQYEFEVKTGGHTLKLNLTVDSILELGVNTTVGYTIQNMDNKTNSIALSDKWNSTDALGSNLLNITDISNLTIFYNNLFSMGGWFTSGEYSSIGNNWNVTYDEFGVLFFCNFTVDGVNVLIKRPVPFDYTSTPILIAGGVFLLILVSCCCCCCKKNKK